MMNMKGYLLGFISVLLMTSSLLAQEDFNIEQVANVPNDENLSDIWGYVADDGTEYAIIGTTTKTEVYSLATPSSPELVFSVSGASSIWRDIKTLGNYAYVTTDRGTDGVTIIDLTNAPDGITASTSNPVVNDTPIENCHNLFIDTTTQIMFLAGCNANDGVLAFDITSNPLVPTLIKEVSTPYAHDIFVRGDLAFSSEIFAGELVIYDISDIQNPVQLGSAKTTNFFTHNAWSSDDNQYVFTTDEVANGTIDAFDISDLMNPVRIDVFVPESILGKGVVPHNTHWMDNYLITSWYSYGVVISDVSNPASVIESGHFNTGDGADCWGVYPYLPSGLIIASDIVNGLYVLAPNYQRGSFITGTITDADGGAAIFDATATLVAANPIKKTTNPKGEYTLGQMDEGTFTVSFNHPDYDENSMEVIFVQGETAEVNIQLSRSAVFAQTINTIDAESGEPVGEVAIQLEKDGYLYDAKTTSDGSFTGSYVDGDFNIIAGKWGYKYKLIDTTFSEDGTISIELEKGYQDDFLFENGWTTETPNVRSEWVRVEPNGTTFGGVPANPGEDVEGDLGNLCYVTGNGVGGAGSNDVDEGKSILLSPMMELSQYPGATVQFSGWFFNDGNGNIAPDDTFKIFAVNEAEKVLIHEFTESSNGWTPVNPINLGDFIGLTDQVQISFEAEDRVESGHLVEAGLDAFSVELGMFVSVHETVFAKAWNLFPNPVAEKINLNNTSFEGEVLLTIYAVDGKVISREVKSGGTISIDAPALPGFYVVNIKADSGAEENIKFTK